MLFRLPNSHLNIMIFSTKGDMFKFKIELEALNFIKNDEKTPKNSVPLIF